MTAQARSTTATHRAESRPHRTYSRPKQRNHDSDLLDSPAVAPCRVDDSIPRRAIRAVIPRRRRSRLLMDVARSCDGYCRGVTVSLILALLPRIGSAVAGSGTNAVHLPGSGASSGSGSPVNLKSRLAPAIWEFHAAHAIRRPSR